VRILCVSGSPSPAAWSRRLLSEVALNLAGRGCDVDELDLRELPLPMLDTVAYAAGGDHPDPAGREWRARVAAADGAVLATSVHHASYAGLLKSALDHLEADAFAGKPVALVANAGAARGATVACEHLRAVVKALSGWATPSQIATTSSDFDPDTGRLLTPALLRRSDALCEELVGFVRAFAPARVP
jgi:NAD(P)H-dependent FMN reductase